MIFFLLISAFGLYYYYYAFIRTVKTIRHVLTEIKYRIFLHFLASTSLIKDKLLKNENKTDLPNRSGQIAIVTGGSRGLGVGIVKMLIQCNIHVIIGCRNVNAGEKLEPEFRKQGIKTGKIHCYHLDLASNKSVREFASKIKEKYEKINILVNNAGILSETYVITEDDFESHFAVNYLGHFLLTHLLMPQLKKGGTENLHSRIVNVTSVGHFAGKINFENINFKNEYITYQSYTQSKLAQVMCSNYLNSKLSTLKIPVQVLSVFPGIVNTEIYNHTLMIKMFPWLPGLLFKDLAEGAMSIIHAALSPKLEGIGGKYISNCQIIPFSKYAQSIEMQEKLFNFSKKLLNIKEFI